ncbi:uncharacterized protein LY89DRAFT_742231 [Mollisia scopiformis]|uniref:C3H1-type domain-containing protein n=1 Tax=Mollisia scopiformis TaxID=149040 RepID=A0A132B6A4_MOLSC|nr:uncharacterized protein LY89DRAFT_742231 [Mollisia scopiformis]KUJ07932.1 hypothetical protein LY89DRAFT_742231 [Mollisia scopiformis]
MPPNPLKSGYKDKPWPGYFLVRTTGEVVPLIAVDELPLGIDLIGVPRSLDLEGTIGMLNLGLQRSSGSHYQIFSGNEHGEEMGQSNGKAKLNNHSAQQVQLRSAPAALTTTPNSTPPSTPKVSSTIRPLTSNPAAILCRHWCHHGICKWGQQCRYRHIMPMTLQGLQEVGLADWPAWYRKLNPGYFINEVQASAPGLTGGRSRTRACAAGGGHGGACCGVLHGRKGERRVGGPSRGLRERGAGRVSKTEELGEQIIARLRGMAREGNTIAGEKGNIMVERAAARDTKNWEDESSDDSEAEVQQVEEVKGNLVDV